MPVVSPELALPEVVPPAQLCAGVLSAWSSVGCTRDGDCLAVLVLSASPVLREPVGGPHRVWVRVPGGPSDDALVVYRGLLRRGESVAKTYLN